MSETASSVGYGGTAAPLVVVSIETVRWLSWSNAGWGGQTQAS